MSELDCTIEPLLRDPQFLLKLHNKIEKCLSPSLSDAHKRHILPLLESVDGRYRELGREYLDRVSLQTLLRPIFPINVVSDRELGVLLHMLPLTEEAGGGEEVKDTVDPVELFLELRQLIPRGAFQIEKLASKARAVIFSNTNMSTFEQYVQDASQAQPRQLVSPDRARKYLIQCCEFSASEALFFLKYCVEPGSGGALDASLLHGLLFSVQVPYMIEYPILAARLTEATKEVTKAGTTGSIALLQALRSVLPQRRNEGSEVPVESTDDLDFGDLSHTLKSRQFYELCQHMNVGFSQEQSDRLYDYLRHPTSPSLRLSQLVRMFRQYFPPVNNSMLYIIKGAITRYILHSGNGNVLCFTNLYTRLRKWRTRSVPIEAYVRALRESGVSDIVTDLHLEWVRLKAPTRVDLILFLCVPLPPSREAIIRKLFQRLSSERDGVDVQSTELMKHFQTDRVEGSTMRRAAENCKRALKEYLEELEDSSLSFDVFGYFWYMISAAVEDDPTYTMLIWQSFSLADRTRRYT